MEDIYCSNCGNDDSDGFQYDDNYGGRYHYKCKICGQSIVVYSKDDEN